MLPLGVHADSQSDNPLAPARLIRVGQMCKIREFSKDSTISVNSLAPEIT